MIRFGVYIRFPEGGMNDHTREQKEKTWDEGWDAIKNQIPQARKALEDEFRRLLGGDS